MECTGTGVVYLAQDAATVTVVDLNGETLQVESEQLLGSLRGSRPT